MERTLIGVFLVRYDCVDCNNSLLPGCSNVELAAQNARVLKYVVGRAIGKM